MVLKFGMTEITNVIPEGLLHPPLIFLFVVIFGMTDAKLSTGHTCITRN